ncbi:MAG: hypothetical protein GX639_05440 [Fibrobacter sp.]|jgi:uncharacterized membrane protein YccC|nr:hypothetical protein [Fibrobacter sp.]
MEKITRMKVLTSTAIVLWILFTIWVLSLMGFETLWPAFTVLNLLTLAGGFDKQSIIKIFASSTAGILLALVLVYIMVFITPLVGESLALYIALFLVLMVLLTVDVVFPMFINTNTFIVLTYALVNVPEFMVDWPKYLATVFIGGVIALIGVMGIIKLVTKKAEETTNELL